MPPKRRVSAPPERVYTSSRPKRQAKLPELEKRVRPKKLYGKKGGPKVAKPDDTLTQMGYVVLEPFVLDDEEDQENVEGTRRGGKRRKTLGDKPATPQYYTQTISQMVESFNSAHSDEPDVQEDSIYDGPYSSPKDQKKQPPFPQPLHRIPPRFEQGRGKNLPPIQTPKRDIREIRSSETPDSINSRRSTSRSPLKDVSVNAPIPFSVNRRTTKSPDKRPRLEVKDTFYTSTTQASSENLVQSSPARRSSVAKSVRFAVPDEAEASESDLVPSPSRKRMSTPGPTSSGQLFQTEIPDTDAESDDEELELEIVSSEGSLQVSPTAVQAHNEWPIEPPESQPPKLEVEECLKESPEQENEEHLRAEPDAKPEAETYYGSIGDETQIEITDLASSRDDVEGDEMEPELESTFRVRTQLMESQRLSTQHVDTMAPRTRLSDVFVSIHPTRLAAIVNRQRDHETRSWPIRADRLWLYETAPVSTLKYMAVIGKAKRPGELVDESGEGNKEFNATKSSKMFAYEILELYELANPLSLSELRGNEWLERPPTKTTPVLPVVIDELMANLKPALFRGDDDAPSSSSTDTQEAADQLMSNIQQFTQLPQSSQLASDMTVESEKCADTAVENPVVVETGSQELVPSSQSNKSEPVDPTSTIPSSQQELQLPKPKPVPASQATTVDLTQASDVVFESPRPQIPSSTPHSFPTLHQGSSAELLVPFSMASSQLMTKSQMLPESLLGVMEEEEQTYVEDSEEEEKEEEEDEIDDDDEL